MSSFIPKPNPSAISYKKHTPQKTLQKPGDAYTSTTVSKNVLKRLDNIDNNSWDHQDGHTPVSQARWMLPYADLLTLLFGLFIALFGLTRSDHNILQNYAAKLEQSIQHTQIENTQLKQAQQQKVVAQHADQALAEQLTKQLATDSTLKHAMTIHPEANGLVISITDHILFQPGQSELSPSAKDKLNIIAGTLAKLNRPIRIEGHTDNSPIQTSIYPSNWELSTARATHIIQYLIQSHRLLPSQLSAAGYGEFHPIANNSSEEGKQKNRRVDIVLLAPPMSHELKTN